MPEKEKKSLLKRGWFKVILFVIIILVAGGGLAFWKAGSILNKISSGNIFSDLIHVIPGVEGELKGETDGRINIAILGMRGEEMSGGGLLADTIMVASIKPLENKASLISIPRDLYVTIPDTNQQDKINAVHLYGEEQKKGQGLEKMKEILEEVTGLPIHYSASINFEGFKQLIDAVGGIKITLSEPFSEPLQFKEEHVCDPDVFTVPSGNFEEKINDKGRIVARYPLCYNENLECGGEFNLPAGEQILNGEQALCYVRSRKTSSDFDRAKRQQIVIKSLRESLFSSKTFTSFERMNDILNSLGDNVRTDMALWEMKKFFDIYQNMDNLEMYQRVLENSQEGLLYHPGEDNGAGYILLPIGDNYDKIHEVAENIFELPPQSDIEPTNGN